MRGDDSYAVLGLRPGAPRVEIDQAYRRLIKRYHPDHAGGDADRAAEVNRAYTELRALSRQPQRPQRPPPPPAMGGRPRQIAARRGPSWVAPMVVLGGVCAAVLLAQSAAMGPGQPFWQQPPSFGTWAPAGDGTARRAALSFDLDDPISTEMIDRSVDDAISLDVAQNPALAAEVSRDCLGRLSSGPSLTLFDSCAAFDEAVSILTAGNPEFESGPFNPLAVTSRQVGAARLLSAGHVESESRLQQIRSRVQMTLLPRMADSGRAVRRKAVAPAPSRTGSRPPLIAVVRQPPAPRPQQQVRSLVSATQPRAQPARVHVQSKRPGSLASAQQRSATVARPPLPTVEDQSKKLPDWQRPIQPEWQRPIKPAWQRPIAPAAGS